MPLPDILQFIGLGRKTGVLDVRAGLSRKRLAFEQGLAVCCSSNNPKEYLGQHLLARTALTEEELERAFREQRRSGRPLGEILVGGGRLSGEELRRVLCKKIEDAMYELFTWESGDFDFEEGELDAEVVPVRLGLTWETLVMEGARRADETARIRLRIPGSHVRFEVLEDRFPEGFPRTGGDRKLVHLARQGLDVASICCRFHLSDFDILTRLSELCGEGLLRVDPASLEQPAGPERDELLQEGSNHLHEGRLAEALATFRTGRERLPDDHAFAEGLAVVEQQLRKALGEEEDPVPELAVSLEEIAAMDLDPKAGFVASRVNGQWSLRSITQICPFDDLEVLALFHQLVQRGTVKMRAHARA